MRHTPHLILQACHRNLQHTHVHRRSSSCCRRVATRWPWHLLASLRQAQTASQTCYSWLGCLSDLEYTQLLQAANTSIVNHRKLLGELLSRTSRCHGAPNSRLKMHTFGPPDPQSTPRQASCRGGTCPDRTTRKHCNRSTSSCHCTSSKSCRPYQLCGKDEYRLSPGTANHTGPKWLQQEYSTYQNVWRGAAAGSTPGRQSDVGTGRRLAQIQRGGGRLNPSSPSRRQAFC